MSSANDARQRGIVCVLAKQPVAGRVKTRLMPHWSPSDTAALASAMLEDTWAMVSALPELKPVLVLAGDPSCIELEPTPVIWPQVDGDLGLRMEHCLRRALEQAPWAIAIGTDSPGLPRDYIQSAAVALAAGHDAVLGPTDDGGYYLLGLQRCPHGLLRALPWSSPETYRATLDRLRSWGASTATLPTWFDVDEPEDLERLGRELQAHRISAPATARQLALLSQDRWRSS